jgi:hypothetical protein
MGSEAQLLDPLEQQHHLGDKGSGEDSGSIRPYGCYQFHKSFSTFVLAYKEASQIIYRDLLEGSLWIKSGSSLSSWSLSPEIKRILNLPSELLSSEQQEDLKYYLHRVFFLQLCIGFFLLQAYFINMETKTQKRKQCRDYVGSH